MRGLYRAAIGWGALLFSPQFPALAAQSGAQSKGEGIAWEPDYAAALEKARKEEKPILIAFNMDDEVANDEAARDHYVDPDVVALSRKMVCLIASIGVHAEPGALCPRFGSVTCEQHRAVEIKASDRYIRTDEVIAPQHLFCAASGVELFRKVYQIPKAALKKGMAIAIAEKGKDPTAAEIAAAERARVERLLKEADSNNAEVRDAAFRELATADDVRAIPALLAKAKSGNDESVRYSAIYALGVKGNYAAIRPLLGFLGDRNAKISIYVLNSLMKIELPDPVPDLLKHLAKERNDRIRGYGLRAIAKCQPGNAEVQKVCLGALKGASAQVEGPCLLALFSLKPDSKVVSAVKPLLSSKNANTRALAAWVLGRQRDPGLGSVLEKIAAEDKALEVREMAAKALVFCKGSGEEDAYAGLAKKFCWDEELSEATGW